MVRWVDSNRDTGCGCAGGSQPYLVAVTAAIWQTAAGGKSSVGGVSVQAEGVAAGGAVRAESNTRLSATDSPVESLRAVVLQTGDLSLSSHTKEIPLVVRVSG